jgi:hypothetical protein
MLPLAQALAVPKPARPKVVHGAVDDTYSKVQRANTPRRADGANQLRHALAGASGLKLTDGATPQGMADAGHSRGNLTLKVTARRDGRASQPGSAGPVMQNSSEVCSRPTG